MPYRRDIDGLRALAVLPVVLCHAGVPGFSGGFIGVDVFFVISGYLITSIVTREVAEGSFSLRSFYERRARRILPALVVMLVASLAAGWLVLLPAELQQLGRSVFMTALFASNIHFARSIDYFDPAAELSPLLHTWSLAVEEQFYLIFPPILLALAALGKRNWTAAAVGAGSAMSLVAAAAMLARAPEDVFYLIPFRGWELGAGAMLALVAIPEPRRRWTAEIVSLAGALAILVPVFAYSRSTPFPGLAALAPVAGAAMLIAAGRARQQSLASRLLSARPMVALGLVSYSLYLWHWPILAFLRIVEDRIALPPAWTSVALAAALLAAAASWRWVEQPFRKPAQAGLARWTIFGSAAAAILLLGLTGKVLQDSGGMPQRLPQEAARIAGSAKDSNPDRRTCLGRTPAQGLCPVGMLTANAPDSTFLLWGDSHAEMLRAGFDTASQEAGVQGYFAGKVGCAPLLHLERDPKRVDCTGFDAGVWSWLDAHPDVPLVIIAVRWTLFVEGTWTASETGPPIGWRWTGPPARRPRSDSNAALVAAALEATVDRLVASGRQVVLLGPVPEPGFNVPRDTARRRLIGLDPRPPLKRSAFDARARHTEDLLRHVAARSASVRFVPLSDLFCDRETCRRFAADGTPLFIDDDHLTRSAARDLLGERLKAIWTAGGGDAGDKPRASATPALVKRPLG